MPRKLIGGRNRQLVSLWDMIEQDAGRLFGLIGYVNVSAQAFRSIDRDKNIAQFVARDIAEMRSKIEDIRDVATALDLPMTTGVSVELLDELAKFPSPDASGKVDPSQSSFSRLTAGLERLQSIKYEASARIFLGLNAGGASLWNPAHPIFGQPVHDAFPSAISDIEESAKCLAVDRGTACVMHLMRAIEVPLKALASMLNIGTQNDWGSYIREIDRELSSRMKASGKRSADELFYAEAAEAFERVKRAWRNRTMHVDAVYTVERARQIFDATCQFMAHLAPKIRE